MNSAQEFRTPSWVRTGVFLTLVGLAALAGASWVVEVQQAPAHSRHFVPAVSRPDFQQTLKRINAALKADWQRHGLRPSAQAPLLLRARRVSLALCGTVPSLEEVRQLEHYSGPHPLDWWTQRLLRDPRCHYYLAERLARPLVGTGQGVVLLYRRQRFVQWLAEQLAQDRPWDAVVREILTAEGLWTDQPQVNFITATVPAEEGKPDLATLTTRTARALLAIQMDCAQCHDHPFDRWEQKDFHQLAAFFSPVELRFSGIRDGKRLYYWKPPGSTRPQRAYPRVPFLPKLLPSEGSPRQRLARWITHPQNRAFARATVNRIWAVMFGRPLVEPVDNIPLDGPVPKVLDILAEDFVQHGFRMRRLIRIIVASEAFARSSQEPPTSAERVPLAVKHWAVFPMTPLRPEQVAGAVLQATSVSTIDYESHVLVRAMRWIRQQEFVRRYGELGPDEFAPRGGTIPQRLLMLNGELVAQRTRVVPLVGAAGRIAQFAPGNAEAVEAVFLATLTRRPDPEELQYFLRWFAKDRHQAIEDLFVTLMNSTEFCWNH